MMENRLVLLKENFNKIMEIRNNIQEIFDILHVKIMKLQNMHSELIQVCKTQLFIFGLDSFHFQNKIIDIEYEDMMRYFLAINNRMYCEYFKLYRIVVDYIKKNTKDSKIMEVVKLNTFPPYKDLEPFKEYSVEVLAELHESLLTLLSSMISHIHNKEHELVMHESKQKIGINIDNFITTFHYSISLMNEKAMLFIKYIEFFHVLHTKYMQRFSNKIQLMYAHINNDIHFEGNVKHTEDLISTTRQPQSDTNSTTKPISHPPKPEDTPTNQVLRSTSLSMDEFSPRTESYRQPPPAFLTKTKSVNDILKESATPVRLTKSDSTDEDIAVYNVFSSIESKCTSIRPLLTVGVGVGVEEPILETKSVDESVSSTGTRTIIHTDPQKRRVRKKKS